MYILISVVTLVILAVCCIIIFVNVQRSPHSQHHGSVRKETKLSVTLLLVTGISVLTILPWAVFSSMPVDIQEELSDASRVEISDMLAIIYFTNSIVNPLVYAIRMHEFRKAIGNLVCNGTKARVNPLQPSYCAINQGKDELKPTLPRLSTLSTFK